MAARKFFFVCAGLFLLALSYHFGAGTATAQAPGNPVVSIATINNSGSFYYTAVTANGDVYTTGQQGVTSWSLAANVFSGGPTPALHESGQLKSHYAPNRGTAQPGAVKR